MDLLIEIIVEIILEGCVLAPFEKKVPFIIRFICGVIIGVCYVGIIGLIMYAAINNGSAVLFIIDILVAVLIAYVFMKKYKEMERKEIKKNRDKKEYRDKERQ